MEQQEQVEWDDVNKLLRHHGFKPVHFADPVENKNLSDLVLLGKSSAGEIRATLKTMLADSERRQALIQELIKSNKQLKEEVQERVRGAARQSQRATELEKLLDDVRIKVQELEERHLAEAVRHGSHVQQLEREREAAQKRRQALELKLSRERERSAELQRKLYFAIKEEERQRERGGQACQLLGERTSRHNPTAHQDVLDVMMAYEAEVTRLKDELRSIRGDCDPKQTPRTIDSSNSSFRTILKVREERRGESGGQTEEPEKEVERLRRELRAKSSREDQRSDLCARYHHLLTEVSALVAHPGAPPGRRRQEPDVTEFDGVLPRLEAWSQQLHLLKELQRGLWRLAARLVPGQLCDGVHDRAEGVKVEEMVLLVDMMLEKSCAAAAAAVGDEKVLRSPTRYTLGAMVSHFQKLFDVSSLSGVYPRMNEVYTRLAEMSTSMKNLREVLGLDSRASPAQVVQQVSRLASSGGQRSKADRALEDADIDSIVVKVKQHEEFFTPFQTLMTDMFQILGVSRLDDVLPAVKTLKQSVH